MQRDVSKAMDLTVHSALEQRNGVSTRYRLGYRGLRKRCSADEN